MAERTRVKRSAWATGVHSRGPLALYGFGPGALAHVLGAVVEDVRLALGSGSLVPVNLVETLAVKHHGLPWLAEDGEAQAWARSLRVGLIEDERLVTMLDGDAGDGAEIWAIGYADVRAAADLSARTVRGDATRDQPWLLRETGASITRIDVAKLIGRRRGWQYVARTIEAAGAEPLVDVAKDEAEDAGEVVDVARRAAAGLRLMAGRVSARGGQPTAKESYRRTVLERTVESVGDVERARKALHDAHADRAQAWLDEWLPQLADTASPRLIWSSLGSVVAYIEDRLREALFKGRQPHGADAQPHLRAILGVP